MSEDKKPEAPRMGAEELLATLVDKLTAQQGPQESVGLTPDKQRELLKPGVPSRWRIIACKSDRTGGFFDAHVVESKDKKNFPEGRIVAIGPYRMPLGRYTYQSNGGIVPDGHPILVSSRGQPNVPDEQEIPGDQLHQMYKTWRTKEFYVLDLREYVGKPMRAAICKNPADIKTSWQEGAPAQHAAE